MDKELIRSRLSAIKEDSKKTFLTCDSIPFGKYKGETLKWVMRNDIKYAYWIINNIDWFKVQPHVKKKIENKYYEVGYDVDYDSVATPNQL